MPDDLFQNLDDQPFFEAYVEGHFKQVPPEAREIFPCSNQLSTARIGLAFSKYSESLQTYKVLLASENPDHYKRSGALLNALYKSRVVTEVKFEPSVFGDIDEVEGSHPLGLSYSDSQSAVKFPNFYKAFYNEILSFDLAYTSCAAYEDAPIEYTFNYLENVTHYLHSNDDLTVDSLSMLFRSLMLKNGH